MRHDARTKDYVTRRQTEGKNRKEIIRCLKRHITREIYRLITNPPPTPNCAKLRTLRQQGGITITQAAHALETLPASQKSNAAETTTTSSLPDTRTGSGDLTIIGASPGALSSCGRPIVTNSAIPYEASQVLPTPPGTPPP